MNLFYISYFLAVHVKCTNAQLYLSHFINCRIQKTSDYYLKMFSREFLDLACRDQNYYDTLYEIAMKSEVGTREEFKNIFTTNFLYLAKCNLTELPENCKFLMNYMYHEINSILDIISAVLEDNTVKNMEEYRYYYGPIKRVLGELIRSKNLKYFTYNNENLLPGFRVQEAVLMVRKKIGYLDDSANPKSINKSSASTSKTLVADTSSPTSPVYKSSRYTDMYNYNSTLDMTTQYEPLIGFNDSRNNTTLLPSTSNLLSNTTIGTELSLNIGICRIPLVIILCVVSTAFFVLLVVVPCIALCYVKRKFNHRLRKTKPRQAEVVI